MSYADFSVSFIEVISRYYSDISCLAYGENYTDIDWLGNTPIAEQLLLDKKLIILKEKYIELVKEEADYVRAQASLFVIGTDLPRMFRVYDQKREQAEAFMYKVDAGALHEISTQGVLLTELTESQIAYLSSAYPLLYREALGTSSSLWTLAWEVLQQYQLSGAILDPILGDIEAVRRNKIAEYVACTTESEVFAVLPPEWPDLSVLSPI